MNSNRPDPITLAETIYHMRADGLKFRQIASKLQMSEGYVSQHLKLLDFPLEIRERIRDGRIVFAHARHLRYWVPEVKWLDYMEQATTMPFLEFVKLIEQKEINRP